MAKLSTPTASGIMCIQYSTARANDEAHKMHPHYAAKLAWAHRRSFHSCQLLPVAGYVVGFCLCVWPLALFLCVFVPLSRARIRMIPSIDPPPLLACLCTCTLRTHVGPRFYFSGLQFCHTPRTTSLLACPLFSCRPDLTFPRHQFAVTQEARYSLVD